MSTVEIREDKILVDGNPTRIISGAMHYFRIHPDLWDDRLDKAVAMGVNCIETYVPWNLHELHKGEFDFSGMLDIEAYIKKVHERGLMMIVRPGPYICSEWDAGGIPGWLMVEPGIELRCMNEPYLAAVKNYFDVLLPKLARLQYTAGGPIILMQIENEYGSYANDKEYLQYLRKLMLDAGIEIPLFTSDGDYGHFLLGGTIPEAMVTVNFGRGSERAWENVEAFRPNSPKFCMEFWNGWFDHWGEKHHTRDPGMNEGGVAYELDKMLAAGANVNFYMLHGGTNFGFTNGANGDFENMYAPAITSYDYGAPINECGDPTEKFYECQKVIAKYTDNPRIKPIEKGKKLCPKPIKFTQSASLLSNLKNIASQSGKARNPPTMEQLGESFGFIHYTKKLEGPMPIIPGKGWPETLRLHKVNDYALVWVNGEFIGARNSTQSHENGVVLPDFGPEGARLDILVENCGHINYGPRIGKDLKGIQGCVAIELQHQRDWEYNMLPMASLNGLEFGAFEDKAATFHKAELVLDEVADCFILRPGTKGVVWVNGFNLGRYWNIGPTETLYVPAPILKKGVNEIIVLELEKLDSDELKFAPDLKLGPTE